MKNKNTLKSLSLCAMLVSLVNCTRMVSFAQDGEGSSYQKQGLTSESSNTSETADALNTDGTSSETDSLTCDGIVDLGIEGVTGRKGHFEITLKESPDAGFTGRVKLSILPDANASGEVLDSDNEDYHQIDHPELLVLASPKIHLAISNIGGKKAAQVAFRIPFIVGNNVPCW